MKRVLVAALAALVALTSISLAGCASGGYTETAQELIADPATRRVQPAEVQRLLGDAVMEIGGNPTKRFWHGKDESVVDLDKVPGTDFSRGRWYIGSRTRYCREMYVSPGSAGGCGRFFERAGQLYLVTDGTKERLHLWRVRIYPAPRAAEPVMNR